MSELIHHFGVDWKLLVAQAVNFFVLLAVLWKFAYQPILRILQKRREEIEKGIRFTQDAETRLDKVEAIGEQKLSEANAKALQIVNQADATARTRKDEIVADASRKGEAIVSEAKRAAGEEKAKALEEVYASAEDVVRQGIAAVLGKIPPQVRDEKLVGEAIRELKALRQTR